MKHIKLIALIGIFFCIAIYAYTQENENTPKLSEEQKRFDLDGNGVLSPEEDQLMLWVTGLEAFTGSKLSQEEIKKIASSPPPNIAPGQRGGPPGFGGGRRGPRPAEKLVTQFDTNKDGKLTGDERKAVLEARGEAYSPEQRAGTPIGNIDNDVEASLTSTPKDSPEFYDAGTLRTLYLRFHDKDWYAQLNAFYRTDVEVPAELVVDGKVYPEVGVRFRGTSSYFTVESAKKSFNVAIDYGNDSQRLYGYKTLNLLNGHVDPSFLREVLFNQIARDYIPAMKTNFVKLVINGESWGVYINLQQYNKDFLDEWFGTRDGVRWKVGPGGGALTYAGNDTEAYQRTYQLKTANVENPWENLIALCEMLDAKTPNAKLETDLPAIFNVDRALWQLAVSNVFMDDDSYIHKGGDFSIYQDVNQRFHLISHDNNETFRFGGERRGGGGGPGGRGPGGWSWGELILGTVSPTTHAENPMRPVISRLLDIPEWKARYIAHVRTVVDEWLDWEVLEPVIKEYHTLIDAEVQKDDKKLDSYQRFVESIDGDEGGRIPSFKRYVTQRREVLLNHPELSKPTPKIVSVSTPENPTSNQPVEITAKLDKTVAADSVLLYYGTDPHSVFKRTEMLKNGDKFVGSIPNFPAETTVYYYVEASAVKTHGTTVFSPARAEFGAAHYKVTLPQTKEVSVVINELMATNTNSIVDPQGDHDDWLELHNITDTPMLLTGMYLTDKIDNPRKWVFPKNTTIPPRGYLIVWLDEDGKANKGLHANFKLSRNGETVMLVDTDARGNQVIDTITFGQQQKDTAIGRLPNATGAFQAVQMTPGTQNSQKKIK
ncbi:MAG: CotH kinase family protein [Candidatus Poribacteria bacterium]|nr:CotH kinase family protein [Candidatus Poribacteria bacterium]